MPYSASGCVGFFGLVGLGTFGTYNRASEAEWLAHRAASWQDGFAGAADALYSGDINTTFDLLLGARSDLGLLFQGDLFEVMIYDRALGGAERGVVEQYLMEKYDIPEPATLALLGCGLAALARRRRRRR